jgi:hypothetical protein
MKISHLLRCAAVGTAVVSNVIYAHEIGANLDCQIGPHEFIEQLIEEKEIDPVPMKVSGNSVNAYRLRPNQNLTALGFKVRAVFGFSQNDDMFTNGGRVQAFASSQPLVLQIDDLPERRAGEPAHPVGCSWQAAVSVLCRTF